MASCPAFDLWTKPELDATLPKVNYRLGHIVVPTLILEHGVAMGEAEDIGDALRIEEVFGCDSRGHSRPQTAQAVWVLPFATVTCGVRGDGSSERVIRVVAALVSALRRRSETC